METIKPTKPESKRKDTHEKLTSTEMGKLWATYMGNTMSQCVLTYYLRHVDDNDINKVLQDALELSKTFVDGVKKIFDEENFPIPIGFAEGDVNLEAPRLFDDEFYLHYLRYAGKAGLSLYSAAIPLVTRPDMMEFFMETLNSTTKFMVEVNDVALAKGFMMKPPPIPTPEKPEFIKKESYFNGFFGDVRPLHSLEITHLYDNIDNNTTSKGLLIGFSQVTKNEKVRDFLLRGKQMTDKHIESCAKHLHNDGLPSPSILDHLVSDSTVAPFSDKLMLFHKVDMFSMKIRAYANALSLNGRRDIGGMYAKFLMDIGLFVEDGANIMIEEGWMEKPPQAMDRDKLSQK